MGVRQKNPNCLETAGGAASVRALAASLRDVELKKRGRTLATLNS